MDINESIPQSVKLQSGFRWPKEGIKYLDAIIVKYSSTSAVVWNVGPCSLSLCWVVLKVTTLSFSGRHPKKAAKDQTQNPAAT